MLQQPQNRLGRDGVARCCHGDAFTGQQAKANILCCSRSRLDGQHIQLTNPVQAHPVMHGNLCFLAEPPQPGDDLQLLKAGQVPQALELQPCRVLLTRAWADSKGKAAFHQPFPWKSSHKARQQGKAVQGKNTCGNVANHGQNWPKKGSKRAEVDLGQEAHYT